MTITKPAVAGTLESSDVMVTIAPAKQSGIQIELQSTVEKQFGKQIRQVVLKTLEELGISSADVNVIDKGALDCTIRARTQTAVYRACGETNYQWKQPDKEEAQ